MIRSTTHWRGFNLIDLFSTSVRWKEFFPMTDGVILEADFEMIRDLGFTFVRVPFSYLFLGKGVYGRTPDEYQFRLVDRAIEYGRKYGVHVMLNMHRAPGYCCLAPSQYDFAERDNLFTDDEPLARYVEWWGFIAQRYRDVPASALSFDLLNEPINVGDDAYNRTFIPAIRAIHAANPDRLVHAEGSFRAHGSFDANGAVDSVGLQPPTDDVIAMPNVVTSFHLYHPLPLTRHNCPWSAPSDLSEPTWPFLPSLREGAQPRQLTGDEAKLWDKEAIRELISPYTTIVQAGYPVHVGEMGAWPGIAHEVYVDYCRDVIDLLTEEGIGYAFWTFRGPFGVIENGFADADYEDYRGHRLDRRLVEAITPRTAS